MPEYNDVIRRIVKMAHKAKVVFVPGNHDEQFREYVGHSFGGVSIELNTIHTTATGKRFLITHGDEFDAIVVYNKWLAHVGSIAYDYLIYANTIVNWFRKKLGMDYWSLAAHIKRRIKNANIYISRYEAAVVETAKTMGFDGVVCGHIHTPGVKMLDGIIYCNTGDWVDSCTALVENDAGEMIVIYDTDIKSMISKQ